MENKKILKILLNDLEEIEEIVNEKDRACFDALEIAFINNRIRGSKKLIQLLSQREDGGNEEEIPQETNMLENNEADLNKQKERVEVIVPPTVEEPEPTAKQAVAAQNKPDILEDKPIVQEIEKEEIVQEETKIETVEKVQAQKNSDEIMQDEPEEKKDQRLGDKFTKEKSVNDLINTEMNNLEHKLSNRPVASIRAAIGINDRFQYIRELFEGDAEKYNETVTSLDNLTNISEAVQYLQNNFNWKKTDISLKFVQLVKRRFPNEV